jgi:hypothetical protein
MAMEEFKFPDEIEAEKKPQQKDDDFDIEIIDDTPAQDRGRKPLEKEVADPTDDEIENYSENVKKRIKDLTHARHDERRVKEATLREKQELERLTQQLLNENKQLKQYVNEGSKQYATTVKSAAESQMEMARRNYKAAQEAFDTDAIIAAQEAMTEAKMRLESAKNFRPSTLQITENPVQTQQTAPQQVQPDEKTLRWQAKNQWFGSQGFEEITSYALGLHQKLVNSGVSPQSDEYYAAIDTRIKKTFPEMFGEDARSQTAENPIRKSANVVAPATRSSGTKKVQLTQTQVALAKKFGLTNQQYAEQLAKLEN